MSTRARSFTNRGLMWGAAGMFLAGALLGQATPRAANGQGVPDSGAQLNQMIRELKTANEKLSEIALTLKQMRDLQEAKPKAESPTPNP